MSAQTAGPDFEGVLGRHDGWDYGGPGVIECEGCGWKSERLGPEWNGRKDDRHRAHVAADLRAEVRAWLESEAKVMSGIGSHRDPCRIPDTECLCGLCDFRAEARAALAALAEQVGQVASVGEGEG